MTKKTSLTKEDQKIFQEAIRGVKPLPYSKVPPPQKKMVVKKQKLIDENMESGFEFSDAETLPPVEAEERLRFQKSGVLDKMLRKLRHGQYNIEATLDLHGKTTLEARELLSDFLFTCQRHGLRTVLIIHGKGRSGTKPILKNKLNHWLRQTEDILAFCSALPKDGGAGALYILLRR